MMWRKKHSEPEISELMIKVGDKEIGLPYKSGEMITGVSGIPVVPKWILKLLHLA
jgi:hypothetical protein